jgi:hypothetical protein
MPAPRALQHLEPIAGRQTQVSKRTHLVQHTQLPQGKRLDLQRQSPASPPIPDPLGLGVGKALITGR